MVLGVVWVKMAVVVCVVWDWSGCGDGCGVVEEGVVVGMG